MGYGIGWGTGIGWDTGIGIWNRMGYWEAIGGGQEGVGAVGRSRGATEGADPHLHAGPARGAPLELLGGPELADLVSSLPGFLLAVTQEGKLVGVSDNVAQHLGHSMVGMGGG